MAHLGKISRYNPFRPGNPTPPGMFAGRINELIELERVLVQTKNGNASHFIVTGERGIGKSSLLMFLSYVARGQIAGLEDDHYKFLVIDFDLESGFSQIDILHRLGQELKHEVAKIFKIGDFAKSTWNFFSRWEVLGVKYDKPEQTELKSFELLDEVARLLEDVSDKLKAEGYDGILLLIDEADKAPATAHLGQISKNLTERLAKRRVGNVALGLAGLPDLQDILRSSHASSPRIFRTLTLDILEPDHRKEVVRKGLAESAELSGTTTTITTEAESMIADLSEGFPSFVQQFSYCAFESDLDGQICVDDVTRGANEKGGAIDELGKKYFADIYHEQIRSDEYRKVLRTMAKHGDAYVSKKQIRDESKLKETTLTNAISVLLARKIIRPKDGKVGLYKLPTKSFAAWLRTREIADASTA